VLYVAKRDVTKCLWFKLTKTAVLPMQSQQSSHNRINGMLQHVDRLTAPSDGDKQTTGGCRLL